MSTRLQGYYPYSEIPFKQGDVVIVSKGTLIKSTAGAPKVSARRQKVKVHHIMPGSMAPLAQEYGEQRLSFNFLDLDMVDVLKKAGAEDALKKLQEPNAKEFAAEILRDLEGRNLIRREDKTIYLVLDNPQVVWPGSGGYWREADVNHLTKA